MLGPDRAQVSFDHDWRRQDKSLCQQDTLNDGIGLDERKHRCSQAWVEQMYDILDIHTYT